MSKRMIALLVVIAGLGVLTTLALMDAGFLVHAVNPKQPDRFRDRFTTWLI